jgi:isopenicillin-N N-acyltransferase-like protein
MKPELRVGVPEEGAVPLLDVAGSSYEAGIRLGYAWKEALHHVAAAWPAGATPWWMDRRFRKLVSRYVPHAPDLYRGMAMGAGIPENRCAEPEAGGPRALPRIRDGCTSFAIQPSATLEGIPISGQTKDTPAQQQFRFVVLRLRLTDAPSALTLTYPGLLFGHGFVAGGCAIFRNSIYTGDADGLLPYEVWGLMALHCRTIAEVEDLTRRHGVQTRAHCTVADEHGGVIGIEIGKGGVAALRPKRGIYVHANAIVSGRRLGRHETASAAQRENSRRREARLRERLDADRGRLTAPLAFLALGDHQHYPASICRHEHPDLSTTAAVVVEPTRRRLTCSRGSPCRNWPRSHSL